MAYGTTINNNISINTRVDVNHIKDNSKEEVVGKEEKSTSNYIDQGLLPGSNTKVSKSNEQFSKFMEERINEEDSEEAIKEEERQILTNLSSEEVELLRNMQINVSDAKLSDILGLVVSMRAAQHNEEVSDIVANTDKSEKSTGKKAVNQEENQEEIDTSLLLQNINNKNNGQIIDGEQTTFIMKNDLDLTLENVYKSEFSAPQGKQQQGLSDKVWKEMLPQIDEVIEEAGLSNAESRYEGARFILDNKLPLTVDNLRTYIAIDDINRNGINQELLTKNIEACKTMGQPTAQANVYYETAQVRGQELKAAVEGIIDEDIAKVISQDKPMTLNSLLSVKGESVSVDIEDLSADVQFITAKRQLEEIRLKMTIEASQSLVTKDLNIDTRPLKEVVEQLKAIEADYYKNDFSKAKVEATQENINLYKETMEKTSAIGQLPSYTLGGAVQEGDFTVDFLYHRGNTNKVALADSAYETMMTTPRSDMGDSIKKAFQNVDDILENMNMEKTTANQRAVRILGYNQMDITTENITAVKSADEQVNTLIKNMTPETVLSLIKEGINPCTTQIDQLNRQIATLKEASGVSEEENYSEYLYRLEKNNQITEEERTSYIGMYRLLDKVAKSDGSDVGYLVNTNRDITMSNLLLAHRSNQGKGKDIVVDDEFGELEKIDTIGNSISQQIEKGYQQRLANNLLNQITPEGLSYVNTTENVENMSLEKLTEALNFAPKNEEIEDACIQRNQDQLAKLTQVGESMVKKLQANQVPVTVTNLVAAQIVSEDKGSIFFKAKELADKANGAEELEEVITSLEENIGDEEATGKVIDDFDNKITQAVYSDELVGTITAEDIASLKLIHSGFNLIKQMSSTKNYQIPVMIQEELSVMNLSVVSQGGESSKMEASIETKQYGKITGEFTIQDNQLMGYLVSDSTEGNRKLKDKEEDILKAFDDLQIDTGEITLGTRSQINKAEGTVEDLFAVAKRLVVIAKTL